MRARSRAAVAARLLGFVLHPQDVETIVGDLEEECASRPEAGYRQEWWYWGQVGRSLPSLLWLPLQRSGWPSTVGVAVAACALQVAIELAAGWTAHRFSPPDTQWPALLTLAVILPSLALLSYHAHRIRPGAATAIAAIGTLVVGVQLTLAATADRGLPLGTLAALVIVPSTAFTGGFLASRAEHR